ncbi:MAG TPA: PilX N-terminal domain-containing pilus assembly protein [Steroidobacteraceae bacterium]|nr:PilX N-terminal domain-containing pilus assembly protein [Steroidobacteraceae bacterium]
MKTHTHLRRQRGAALVIGLILLMIITLLAVVGMNMSNSELQSATSEQLRLRAFSAAETGSERGLQSLGVVGTTWPSTAVVQVGQDVLGVGNNTTDGTPLARYQNTLQYQGDGPAPNSSIGFRAFHYTVISTGTASRNTVAVHTVGAFIVNKTS